MTAVINAVPLSMLQIGLIASPSQTSGSDRYYFELLRALRAQGDQVRGVVLGDPSAIQNPIGDVESFAPEGSRAWRRWTGLRRVMPQLVRGSNIVVSHMAAHAFPVLDQIAARPLVVHFHGPWALEGRADGHGLAKFCLRQVQERSVYSRGARIIALSQAFADILERHYRVDPSIIRIVPGGVDLARFDTRESRAQARERLGWPLDRPVIATVRRLVPTKGIEQLIEAVAMVRAEVPDLFVGIAGTGPLAGDLQRLVHERGLDDTVKFAGYISDEQLPLLYRAADAFVVPTQALEGFGLVVVEALACGTPAIVTPVGGLPEAVRGLDPSLVLAGSSAEHIARGIADAMSGRVPLPSEKACIDYAHSFEWSNIARRVRAIYREVA